MGTDSTPIDDAEPSSRRSLGPAIASVPDPTPLRAAVDSGTTPGAWFAVVLRGYDRAQVDARLAELDRRIRDEIMRADGAEAALTAARAHVRRLQDTVTPASDDHGFGLRVERVLNAAEREASEVRENAAREAESLLEKAREESERARRQTEEALLGRAAKLDDEFAARSAALDSREQEVDRIVERARREADEIRAEAGRAAAESTAAAERAAADLRIVAEQTIQRERANATRDIGRMATLRDEVRHELSRLQEMLRTELDPGRTDTDPFGAATAALSRTDPPADAPPTAGPAASTIGSSADAETTDTDAAGIAGVGSPDRDSDARTEIGAVPPYSVASIGVLPFGDRSAGGPANGRAFSFELVPDMRSDTDDDGDDQGDDRSAAGGSGDGTVDDIDRRRTSENASGGDSAAERNPTRSTMPSRGRR